MLTSTTNKLAAILALILEIVSLVGCNEPTNAKVNDKAENKVPQAIAPGYYSIETLMDNGDHYCLDRNTQPSDIGANLLHFMRCTGQESQQFRMEIGDARGFYLIRNHADIIERGNIRKLDFLEEHVPTLIYNDACEFDATRARPCESDFQLWQIGEWPGATNEFKYNIKTAKASNTNSNWAKNGACIDRRDKDNPAIMVGGPLPQLLDCRDYGNQHFAIRPWTGHP